MADDTPDWQKQRDLDYPPVPTVAQPAGGNITPPTVDPNDGPDPNDPLQKALAQRALDYPGEAAAAAAAASAPATTGTGLAKNTAAGVLDTVANTGNVWSDPFSYLVGRPLLMAGAFAHDAIAPYVGWNRLTDKDRSDLYGSTSDFQQGVGNKLVNAAGVVVNKTADALGSTAPDVTLADVKANTPTEAAARNVTGAVGSTLAMVPGVLPAIQAGVGALAGQKAAEYVPDWAKDATQAATNVAAATATGAALPATVTAAKNAALKLGTTDPTTASLALAARDYGIDVRGPQLGLPPIQKGVLGATSAVPLSGYGSEIPRIQTQYHNAIADELGIKLGGNTRITSPLLDKATMDIANKKAAIEMSTPVAGDSQFTDKVADIETQARASLPPTDAATVTGLIQSTIQNGGNYQDALASVRSAMQNPGVPAGVKHFAGQIEDAAQYDLIRNTTNHADADDYENAIAQGKVADVLNSIPRSTDGTFNPLDFRAAVRDATSRGIIDPLGNDEGLADLGHISGIIPSAPSKLSSNIHTALKAVETGASLLGGHMALGGVIGGFGGPAAAVGVPVASRLAGAYLRSSGLANRMIRNGTMRGTGSRYPIPSLLPTNPLTFVPEATNQNNPLQQPASP